MTEENAKHFSRLFPVFAVIRIPMTHTLQRIAIFATLKIGAVGKYLINHGGYNYEKDDRLGAWCKFRRMAFTE